MKNKLLFVASLGLLLGCTKRIVDWRQVYQMPHGIAFIIKHQGERLPDSVLDLTRLSYYEQGQTKYVDDFGRAPVGEGYEEGVLSTRDIGFVSGSRKVKNFLLVYPEGPPDTLFVDIRELQFEEALKDPCVCEFPLREVLFNNKVPGLEPFSFKVFLFEK